MITTSDYIITATLGGGKFHFEYEAGDVWDALGEFWHDDYPDILDSLEGSEWFPLDVEALDGGKAVATYCFGFNASLFHYFFDHGTVTIDEFHRALLEERRRMDAALPMQRQATSLFFYMWNAWCEQECRKVWHDGDYNHFWRKWCGISEQYGRFGAVEHFYAELSNGNRDRLVRRATELYDGQEEKY